MEPVQQANGILAGTGKIANMLEMAQQHKQDEKLRRRFGADSVFQPTPYSQASRGDYDPNTGMFRPNMMVPTQFQGGYGMGYGYGSYQSGGEYYMDDNDIQQILAQGREIEYID